MDHKLLMEIFLKFINESNLIYSNFGGSNYSDNNNYDLLVASDGQNSVLKHWNSRNDANLQMYFKIRIFCAFSRLQIGKNHVFNFKIVFSARIFLADCRIVFSCLT